MWIAMFAVLGNFIENKIKIVINIWEIFEEFYLGMFAYLINFAVGSIQKYT